MIKRPIFNSLCRITRFQKDRCRGVRIDTEREILAEVLMVIKKMVKHRIMAQIEIMRRTDNKIRKYDKK